MNRDRKSRQGSLLPHEFIEQAHQVEVVLWNGPKRGSRTQIAGSLLLGAALLFSGWGVAVKMWSHGMWPEAS